jgi:predicted alpha/beta superfamily hydrolase
MLTLDLACALNLGIPVPTVFAPERGDDDFSEVRDARQQQSSDTLSVYQQGRSEYLHFLGTTRTFS